MQKLFQGQPQAFQQPAPYHNRRKNVSKLGKQFQHKSAINRTRDESSLLICLTQQSYFWRFFTIRLFCREYEIQLYLRLGENVVTFTIQRNGEQCQGGKLCIYVCSFYNSEWGTACKINHTNLEDISEVNANWLLDEDQILEPFPACITLSNTQNVYNGCREPQIQFFSIR